MASIYSLTLSIFFLAFTAGPVFAARLPFIIAGDEVKDASRWPWQGSLRFNGAHTCGVALLSSRWAVTAAHCLGAPPIAYKLQFGSLNRKEGGQEVHLDKQIIHEKFGLGETKYANDIGLVQFEALTLGANVKPVTRTKLDYTGETDCYITGWGYTSTGGSGSPATMLQEAKIPVESNESCKNMWGDDISDGNVCVWDTEGKRTACNGDSGGPLVCRKKGVADYELVGVLSWGVGGCYPTFWPAVYTRITYFSDWIETNMK